MYKRALGTIRRHTTHHSIAPPSHRTAFMSMTAANPTEFVVLGSGVSTGIPRISCIIRPTEDFKCPVCHDANENLGSKNRRGNVSALVRAAGRTVLIDCGKTIRDTSMLHFPSLGVRCVDAIVITHGHADAVLGLDDARDIQVAPQRTMIDGKPHWGPTIPTPVFVNEETMAVCRNVFPYLTPSENGIPEGTKKDIKRRVAALDWHVYGESDYFKPFKPLSDAPIVFTPIPMLHGGSYICMGFLIHLFSEADTLQETPTAVIAYLSDLHELPTESADFLQNVDRIDLLVVDMLTDNLFNRSHFCKAESEALVRKLRPKQAVAVGMTCSLGMHDVVSKEIEEDFSKEGLSFRLAYDGERFPF